jgi:hypothetical protein
MTVEQFVEKFRLLTEVVSSYEAPGLLDVEIYDLLNISQKEITIELCTARKFDKLYSLITQGEVLLTPELISPLPNTNLVYRGDIDDNFFYPINGQIAISRSGLSTSGFIPDYSMGNTIVKLKEIDIEYSNTFIENPFNKNVILLNPLYWIESQGVLNNPRIKVIMDSYTTLGSFTTVDSQPNVIINYIKTPADFNESTTSELPENLHEIILNKAVEKRNMSLVNNANKN